LTKEAIIRSIIPAGCLAGVLFVGFAISGGA
jgi:hypothetical protein